MSGNLYQLRYNSKYMIGSEVIIKGPYDKKGIVLSRISNKDTKQGYLYLVRGIGNEKKSRSI